MIYTDEQLKNIQEVLLDFSVVNSLSDKFLTKHEPTSVRRTDLNLFSPDNFADGLVVAGGEFIYGIPMIDMQVVLDIISTYEDKLKCTNITQKK